jgi:hypothetical protein
MGPIGFTLLFTEVSAQPIGLSSGIKKTKGFEILF